MLKSTVFLQGNLEKFKFWILEILAFNPNRFSRFPKNQYPKSKFQESKTQYSNAGKKAKKGNSKKKNKSKK